MKTWVYVKSVGLIILSILTPEGCIKLFIWFRLAFWCTTVLSYFMFRLWFWLSIGNISWQWLIINLKFIVLVSFIPLSSKFFFLVIIKASLRMRAKLTEISNPLLILVPWIVFILLIPVIYFDYLIGFLYSIFHLLFKLPIRISY